MRKDALSEKLNASYNDLNLHRQQSRQRLVSDTEFSARSISATTFPCFDTATQTCQCVTEISFQQSINT